MRKARKACDPWHQHKPAAASQPCLWAGRRFPATGTPKLRETLLSKRKRVCPRQRRGLGSRASLSPLVRVPWWHSEAPGFAQEQPRVTLLSAPQQLSGTEAVLRRLAWATRPSCARAWIPRLFFSFTQTLRCTSARIWLTTPCFW